MKCFRLLPLVLLVVAGCAHYQPGQGVTRDFARAWGCNHAAVMQEAELNKFELPEGKVYIPQVGWNACELLAHNGRPNRVDHQQTRYGRSATWWYHAEGAEAHMVTLEQDGPSWIVSYVGW